MPKICDFRFGCLFLDIVGRNEIIGWIQTLTVEKYIATDKMIAVHLSHTFGAII